MKSDSKKPELLSTENEGENVDDSQPIGTPPGGGTWAWKNGKWEQLS